MTIEEFEQVAAPLGELEDYLREQHRLAKAIGHTADAGAFETALQLAIGTHAQAQLLISEPIDFPACPLRP